MLKQQSIQHSSREVETKDLQSKEGLPEGLIQGWALSLWLACAEALPMHLLGVSSSFCIQEEDRPESGRERYPCHNAFAQHARLLVRSDYQSCRKLVSSWSGCIRRAAATLLHCCHNHTCLLLELADTSCL